MNTFVSACVCVCVCVACVCVCVCVACVCVCMCVCVCTHLVCQKYMHTQPYMYVGYDFVCSTCTCTHLHACVLYACVHMSVVA